MAATIHALPVLQVNTEEYLYLLEVFLFSILKKDASYIQESIKYY